MEHTDAPESAQAVQPMEDEIEIKLKIESLEKTIERLRQIGCSRVSDFRFEDNFLYDFPDLSLQERGIILRIREYGAKSTVTLKEKAEDDRLYKVRSETEFLIGDPAAARKIFETLGLKAIYRYQKYRAEYKMCGLSICIDRTPIGDFIELEGDRVDIDAGAAKLGYEKDDYINISYRALQTDHLKERGLPPSDMLFEPRGTEKPYIERQR